MKSKIIFALLALGLASCAPNPGVVSITSFSNLAPGSCNTVEPEAFRLEGRLNIAGGQSPNVVAYYIQVNYQAAVTQPGLATQSGQQLENPDRDTFVFTNVHLTYSIRKGAGGLKVLTKGSKPVTDDFRGAVVTKANGIQALYVNLIGPNASEALFDEIVPASSGVATAEDSSELRVGVEIVGHMSGTNVPVNSGKVEFPLTVYNASKCPAFANVFMECPFPGQDLTEPKCE